MLKKLDDKGQVALFVALIFQVLFVFFAMIVNVGLLVHHKINLQNSVDLAAYYGAMKQAEMMNAIGHINYQIRQSWKLMSFRYGQLGTAGAFVEHPYKPKQGNQGVGTIQDESDSPWGFGSVFCIPYNPISIVNENETYCKSVAGIKIPLPAIPNLGPANFFVNFQTSIRSAAQAFNKSAQLGCQRSMAVNWLQLAQFIQTYKVDVRNRKKLLLALANEISKSDPNDIDGQSIRTGTFKTLFKNLTYQNQESLRTKFSEAGQGSGDNQANFKFINSFAENGCTSTGNDQVPPQWLSEIFIYPLYFVVDGKCTGDNNAILDLKADLMNGGGAVSIPENARVVFPDQTQAIYDFIQEYGTTDPAQLLYRSSIGFEKNPWCVGYVGVSATTTPKIPFTPLGDVTMKATAFAKPFGGRIGPWFNTKWPEGANKSDPGSPLTDKVLPMRVEASSTISGVTPQDLIAAQRAYPNHSRYMGDEAGTRSKLTMAQYGKALHENNTIELGWYNNMIDEIKNEFDQKGENGDVLAWNKNNNSSVFLRNLEIAAIVPDQFDVANYSIDPDFYNNYLIRIEKGYGTKLPFLLRGDYGSKMNGTKEEKRFSIRNQLDTLKTSNPQLLDWQNKLTYYINEFGQLLTSWQQKTPDEYVLDESRFGKCVQGNEVGQDEDEKFYTPGSCKAGGRTGYSVKLVDGKFLANEVNGQNQSYELGGKGVTGQIKNPPPTGF